MQPIILPRSLWQYLLQGIIRSDMTTGERIATASIEARDYQTRPFLALRLKIIRGILRGLNDEAVQKLADEKSHESDVEILLTCGELTYLDLALDMTAFQGAVKVKQSIWKALEDSVGEVQ